MMKIRSILTGIAISLSLAGMAQSQYDGAPVSYTHLTLPTNSRV